MSPGIIAAPFGKENVLAGKIVEVTQRIQKNAAHTILDGIHRAGTQMGWSPLATWFPFTSPAEIPRARRRARARLPHSERLPPLGICCGGGSAWVLHSTLSRASRRKRDYHESESEETLSPLWVAGEDEEWSVGIEASPR